MSIPENSPPGALPSADVGSTGSDDMARLLGDRERRRAFEHARHEAATVSKWATVSYAATSPELLERYRWLIVAMAIARGTPGAFALAELGRRGYVLDGTTKMPIVRPIDRILVIGGAGLPRRHSFPLAAMECRAATIDLTGFPPLSLASAHETIRIKAELRREGHDLG